MSPILKATGAEKLAGYIGSCRGRLTLVKLEPWNLKLTWSFGDVELASIKLYFMRGGCGRVRQLPMGSILPSYYS